MLPNNFQASGGQLDQQQPERRQITLAEMQVKANEFKSAIVAGESRIRNLRDQALTSHLPPESVAQEISKVQKEVMERRQALQKIMLYLRPAGTLTRPCRPVWKLRKSLLESNTPQLPQIVTSRQNQANLVSILDGGSSHSDSALPTQRLNPISNLVPLTFQYLPLNRDAFTEAYFQQWLPKHPIDQSILSLDGRDIDLWALHSEVMTMNGYRCFVQQLTPNQPRQIIITLAIVSDQWPIIAGRLGFVNFPGDAREPAKSGPVVAVHLERVYRQCLLEFDSQYLRQLIHYMNMSGFTPQKPNGMENGALPVVTAPEGLSDLKNPEVISEIMSYTTLSVQEMVTRNVPPPIISLIQKHRDQLKSMAETQRSFQLQGFQNAAPQTQPHSVSNPAAMGNVNHTHHLHAMETTEEPDALNEIINNYANLSIQESSSMNPSQPINMPSTSTTAPSEQPQQYPRGSALIPIDSPVRPTQAQTTAAVELVRRLKEENKHVGFPTTRPLHMSDVQRLEYNAQFERLDRLVTALDVKLLNFAVCMKEEVIKKLVALIQAVRQQREALSSNPPQYYMPLPWVIAFQTQVMQTEQVFHQWVNSAMRASQQADTNQSHADANSAAQPSPSN